MMRNPTVIWRAQQTDTALSTYEAYKLIDEIATLEPERFVITAATRDDLFQLIQYARRRGLTPAFRMPPHATPDDARALTRTGAATLIFRIDSTASAIHDAMHGAGSFTNTLRTMRFSAEQKIAIEAESLVTHATAPALPQLADLIATFGARTWNVLFPVPPLPHGFESLSAAEAEKALETLAAIALDIRTIEAPQIVRFHGTAVRDIVFIDPAGQVRPSEFAHLSSGSARYRRLESLIAGPVFRNWTNPDLLHGKCARCEFRAPCGGSRARAWAMTGDVYAADPLCVYQPKETI